MVRVLTDTSRLHIHRHWPDPLPMHGLSAGPALLKLHIEFVRFELIEVRNFHFLGLPVDHLCAERTAD